MFVEVLLSVQAPAVQSAIPAARAASISVASEVAGYGAGPGFKVDASKAQQLTEARVQRLERFHEINALQKAEGLLGVTLGVITALGNTLDEMRNLAVLLQDETIATEQRQVLTDDFDRLSAQLDDLTASATFAGQNLINPEAAEQTGTIALPSGSQIAAHDLRKGQGTILPISLPAEAPLLDSLRGAFAFEGNFTREALGTSGFKSVKSFAPVTYSEGESGGQGVNASYTGVSFFPTAGATVSASFQFNQPRTIIQHIVSGDFRDAATVSINASNKIVVAGNAKTITGPELTIGHWYDISIAVSDTGNARIYLDSTFIGDLQYRVGLPTSRNDVTIFAGSNTIDNLSVYSRQLSASEIGDVVEKSQGGVQNWRAGPPGGSDWSMVAEDLHQSLANLRNVEVYYGRVARNVESTGSLLQRRADAIDLAVNSLVVPDLGRLAAKQAAADVRAQIALATMDTQRAIMNSPVSLLASTLDAFDRMMTGRFTPSRLRI